MPFELTLKDDCPEMIARRAQDALHVLSDFYDLFAEDIQEAAKVMSLCFAGEQRVFTAGLGVSSCLARALAGRLVAGRASGRLPLPATALSGILASGDEGAEGLEQAFVRQLEAYGSDGDILVLLSPDGAQPALVRAAQTGHEQGMFVLGITGGDGGALAQNDLLDLELRVPSIEESLVHEVHMGLVCLLDDLIDYYLSCKPEILKEMLHSGISRLQDDLDGE
ncbi:MAG: SIS domain-containing protein [Desulfovibrionaceae bacterium]|nr:SIS domain-containing protein [Desulfovibrionaceae bacterium]